MEVFIIRVWEGVRFISTFSFCGLCNGRVWTAQVTQLCRHTSCGEFERIRENTAMELQRILPDFCGMTEKST
jgi:hypothetical protein